MIRTRWRDRPLRVAGTLALLALAACRGKARPAPPFSRTSVLAQIGPSFPGVTLPPDDLPAGVVADEDLVYARVAETDLALDIYRPSRRGPYPAVIVVHGGGWERGDRRMERPLAKQLAGRGFVSAAVSYRLGDAGRFPNALFDLESAIRWLRAHAARYDVDPAHIGAVGGSAGGHLVALLGVSAGTPGLEGGVGDGDARVQAVVDIDGLADFAGPLLVAKEEKNPGAPTRFLGGSFAERPASWHLASPLTHVRAGSAPTLFIDSSATSGAPRAGAPILPGRVEMRDRLRALGIPSELVILPDTPHPFWLVNPWFDVVLARSEAFLNQHLRGKK
jgi:acetyl esterase/lipase